MEENTNGNIGAEAQAQAAEAAPQPTDEQVAEAIDTALDEAVASVSGAGEKPKEGEAEAEPEAKPQEEAKPQQADAREEPKPQADLKEEQALFERGIRAGLSVAELTAIPTHALAEKMVSMAEKSAGILPKKEEGAEGAGEPADELAKALEEMRNDGEYDPKILGLLEGLYKENQALKKAGQTADREGFFEREFGSLDEGVRRHVDAARLATLRSKFGMLEAGYRAQGAQVPREEVFREAAQLALGDLIGKAAEERKADALERRKNLALARPGGENGYAARRTGPATEEDIASEIWDQINRQ